MVGIVNLEVVSICTLRMLCLYLFILNFVSFLILFLCSSFVLLSLDDFFIYVTASCSYADLSSSPLLLPLSKLHIQTTNLNSRRAPVVSAPSSRVVESIYEPTWVESWD